MNNQIAIRPITIEDTEKIVNWRNSINVRKNLYCQDPLSTGQHINYFHNYIETRKVIQFIIAVIEKGKQKDIGTTFIKNIDFHSRKAEFGIFIGDDTTRGKGYGAQATRLTVKYAFEQLMLNRVYLTVFEDNSMAINAYKKCGFKVEGILKQDYLRDKFFIDVVIMGITRTDWKGIKDNE